MNRASWLLGQTTQADLVLEIGPSYSPIAPKAAGWRTYVVDHASQEELRGKYRPMGVDVDAIEVVDSVWSGGALHEALPARAANIFGRLIASHVIEHIPNLVAFFTSASRLLLPDGIMALAVPDSRYCFDFFKPLTTTGDVLEASRIGRTRHSRGTVWNQVAYSVVHRGAGSWGDDQVPDLTFTSSLDMAAQEYARYADADDAPYEDCHAWQFTPSRFQLVVLELGQLGLIEWRVLEMMPSGAEFLCTLRRGVESLSYETLQRRRMNLLYRGLVEARAQIDRALGEGRAGAGEADWGALDMLRGARVTP